MAEPKPTAKAVPKPPEKYVPPSPGPVVVWRPAPGGEPNYAIVTRHGKSAIDLMVFPPESRVGAPKSGVRYVGDPQVKINFDPEAGVWDHTDESRYVRELGEAVANLVGGK